MATDYSSLHSKTKVARTLSFVLFVEMLLSFSVWQLTRSEGPSYFFWAIQCLPLMIFLPGMLKDKPKTYIMLCFVLLMYFVQGVTGSMASNAEWIDFAILGNSILLFISAMLTSRWLAMQQKASSQV